MPNIRAVLAATLGILTLIGATTAFSETPRTGGTLVVATTNDTPDLDIQKYISSSQHNALMADLQRTGGEGLDRGRAVSPHRAGSGRKLDRLRGRQDLHLQPAQGGDVP